MTPWWLGLAPAQATILCAGADHRLSWAAGELRALDHGDPEAERTLAALGGQRCPCVETLDAWARHAEDLRALVLAPRGPSDSLHAPAVTAPQRGGPAPAPRPAPVARALPTAVPSVTGAIGGWISSGPMLHGLAFAPASEVGLIELLRLGGGLPDRFVAGVLAAWAGRTNVEAARGRLHAALHGRVAASLRAWLGPIEVDVHMLEDSRPPTVVERSGIIEVGLPFAWLLEVWARGFATLAGRFALAASTTDGQRWTLTTVGPDLGPPLPVTLELPPGPTAG